MFFGILPDIVLWTNTASWMFLFSERLRYLSVFNASVAESDFFLFSISSGLYEVNMESLGFKTFYVLEIMYLNRKSPYFGFWVAQKFVHGPKGSWVEKKRKKSLFWIYLRNYQFLRHEQLYLFWSGQKNKDFGGGFRSLSLIV